jgi:predicted nucleic acid-binding protein
MSLALDTNVLIPWLIRSAPGHAAARRLVSAELHREGGRIAILQQVCWEFLHVVTDPRRFEDPLAMNAAIALVRAVWNAPDTFRVISTPDVMPRVLDLMAAHHLGRKRILDTALAATLEAGGVSRLATFNAADFRCFEFIEVVDPNG